MERREAVALCLFKEPASTFDARVQHIKFTKTLTPRPNKYLVMNEQQPTTTTTLMQSKAFIFGQASHKNLLSLSPKVNPHMKIIGQRQTSMMHLMKRNSFHGLKDALTPCLSKHEKRFKRQSSIISESNSVEMMTYTTPFSRNIILTDRSIYLNSLLNE